MRGLSFSGEAFFCRLEGVAEAAAAGIMTIAVIRRLLLLVNRQRHQGDKGAPVGGLRMLLASWLSRHPESLFRLPASKWPSSVQGLLSPSFLQSFHSCNLSLKQAAVLCDIARLGTGSGAVRQYPQLRHRVTAPEPVNSTAVLAPVSTPGTTQ